MLSDDELLDDESLSLVAPPVAVPCWPPLPLPPPSCPRSPRIPPLGWYMPVGEAYGLIGGPLNLLGGPIKGPRGGPPKGPGGQ